MIPDTYLLTTKMKKIFVFEEDEDPSIEDDEQADYLNTAFRNMEEYAREIDLSTNVWGYRFQMSYSSGRYDSDFPKGIHIGLVHEFPMDRAKEFLLHILDDFPNDREREEILDRKANIWNEDYITFFDGSYDINWDTYKKSFQYRSEEGCFDEGELIGFNFKYDGLLFSSGWNFCLEHLNPISCKKMVSILMSTIDNREDRKKLISGFNPAFDFFLQSGES